MRIPIALCAMLLSATAIAGETATIDSAALLKRIDSKDASLLILDVRTPAEFAAGHVPGAINIPHSYLPARSAELASDKDVVIYCATGVRSELAASRLRENGFTRLLHLDGDMTGWVEGKRRIEK